MSVKIMSVVWEHAPYTAGSLLVFLALADWSNDEGVSWPSVGKIAAKTRLERRSIQYIIRQLKKDGMIEIEEGGGRGHQHRFTIKVQNLHLLPNLIKGAIDDTERAQSTAQKVQSTTEKVKPVAPDPLEEPLEEPSVDPSVAREAKFWSDLKANPAYRHIDLGIESGRMRAWLALPKNKGRKMSQAFVVNWLNKIDPPLNGNGRTPTSNAPAVSVKKDAAYYIASFEKGLQFAPNYDVAKEIESIADEGIREEVSRWYQNAAPVRACDSTGIPNGILAVCVTCNARRKASTSEAVEWMQSGFPECGKCKKKITIEPKE